MPSTAPVIDIVSAINHPGLFAPWFPGASWDHFRGVLKAAFALPMTESEREFFRTVAERDPPTKQVRQLWCVVGRGGGKDSIASLIAAFAAALFEHRRQLRPGETALVQCLACDRTQSKIVLDYTRSYFTENPAIEGDDKSRDGERLPAQQRCRGCHCHQFPQIGSRRRPCFVRSWTRRPSIETKDRAHRTRKCTGPSSQAWRACRALC